MPRIGVIAGEPSGDRLGAELVAALREQLRSDLEVIGVGGEALAEQGVVSLFPLADIAVMGLVEILPRIGPILARVRLTARAMIDADLDAMLTIDSMGFNARVARRVRKARPDLPILHYAAPKLWAWWPGRARRMRHWVSEILVLFPFEPEFFGDYGIKAEFVGHPVVTRVKATGMAEARFRLGISSEQAVLTVLPGSRAGEVKNLASIFGETIKRISARHPDLTVLVPTVPNVSDLVRTATAGWPVAPRILTGEADKFTAFSASDAALAASGTVSLELAASGTPHIVGYRMAPLTVWLARRLVRIKYASLINILHNEAVVPEYLQEDCIAEKLAPAVQELLAVSEAADRQREKFRQGLIMLGAGDQPPAKRAAEAVLDAINQRSSAAK